MQIRQLNRYTFDVFLGNGFDNWSRVRKQHWGVSVVAGNRLAKPEIKAVFETLEKHPRGSTENL